MAARTEIIKIPAENSISVIEDFAQFLIDNGVEVVSVTEDGENFILKVRSSFTMGKAIRTLALFWFKKKRNNPDDIPQEKRFRRWGVSRRQARAMKHAQLVHLVGELGWVPAGGTKHLKYRNIWIPGYSPNIAMPHKGGEHRPGHVAAYSDAFGFTRVDLERTLRKEVRIILFLERAIMAFPEHDVAIRKHYDTLKREYLADPSLLAEYERARAPVFIETIMGTPPIVLEEEEICANCGQSGHLYENCDLPYLYITGWSKSEEGPWEGDL